MSMIGRLRRIWLNVHLWIGVGLLVALVPLGVTGSILVWHDPLDRALHAERYATSGPTVAKPVAAYAAAAEAAFQGQARLTQIRFPERAGDPVVAVGRLSGPAPKGQRPRSLNAWIDPPTARVLDVAEPAAGFTLLMHRVHGTLLIPEIGRKVVGWLGWAMFVSTATGLWLWWPRGGGVLKGLRWRRGPSTLSNLHHTVGFWICLPLAVLSLTGVYLSFPETSRAVFGIPSPPPRPPGARFAPPIETPRLTPAQAAALAQATLPGGELAELNTPTRGREPVWRVRLRGEDGPPRTIEIVDATGAVKPSVRAASPGGGPDPLSRLMRRIHDGTDMGIVWQTVIFAAGLAPALLSATGVVMWLTRRARRRALQA